MVNEDIGVTESTSTEEKQSDTGQQLQGETLLTRQQDEKNAELTGKIEAETPQEIEKDKSQDALTSVPENPDGYLLSFAEGTPVDKGLLENFRQEAHKLGMTQGQAQCLADLYAGYAADSLDKAQKEQEARLTDARRQWEEEIRGSATFEADRGLAQNALRQYGSKELYSLLDQTNLGSNPEMFNFLAKVGKALAEPGFKGQSAVRERSAAQVLYPDMG